MGLDSVACQLGLLAVGAPVDIPPGPDGCTSLIGVRARRHAAGGAVLAADGEDSLDGDAKKLSRV
jgi:hypothetical protein